MKFKLQNMQGEDVLGGAVSLDNVYISTYGSLERGKPPAELELDEHCVKVFALSGGKPTEYVIVRVE